MTSIFVCRLPSRVSYLVVWLSFLCYCNCINKSLWVDGQNWMCVSCSVFVISTALFGLTFSVTEKTRCQSRREEDVLYFLSYTKTKRIMLFFFATLLCPELHSRRSRVFNLLLCLKVHRLLSLSLSLSLGWLFFFSYWKKDDGIPWRTWRTHHFHSFLGIIRHNHQE